MQKKRKGPIPVAPASSKGVRYEALHWGKSKGLDQNGGYVVAIDEKNDKELWCLKVYNIAYDPEMEEDVQDIFIVKLTVSGWRNRLTVKDEKGRRFLVDLKSRVVIPS